MTRIVFYSFSAIAVGLIASVCAATDLVPEKMDQSDGPAACRLAYQFKPGETVRWRVVHQATVQTTIQGTTQTARTRTESVKAWRVTKVTQKGTIELVHSVERVKMTNELPHRARIEYDSSQDTEPPPGFETVARTVGVPLTVVSITPQGKVLQRTEKLHQPGNQPDMPITIPLPATAVTLGHVWSEPYELSVPGQQGQTQPIKTRRRFELTRLNNGVATITVDYQVLTPVRDPAIEAQLAQRLSHGSVRFDVDTGRILSQQMDVDKRVLGFNGPTSSIHHVIRRTEQLLEGAQRVARSGQ